LAQGAVSAIKQGVDFLHQGRIALESTKKTVDGVVADVKAIKNIFDWFIGLFISKPKAETAKPVAKTAAKSKPSAAKEKSYQQLESELIRDIGENLGLLFDTQQQINTYYEELEEDSKTNYDPTQNTSKKAIQRVIIQLELEKLMEATREAMVYSPPECKDMYSRFLLMYGKIEQEQKWARAEMIRRARLARWRKEEEEIRHIEMISGGIAVTFISLIFGWFMWQLHDLSGGF
jgi:hypothetical protein